MHGDFDRVTFNPESAFTAVMLQQGRLLLPSDFNEQGAILQHFLRRLVVDLKGANWKVGAGFDITVENPFNLTIAAGHFYVDGVLCENPEDCLYTEQPHWPVPTPLSGLADNEAIVYLDCHERHVSCLQEPRIREVALGGIDTATRVQIVWQVRVDSRGLSEQLDAVGERLDKRHKAADAKRKKVIEKRQKLVADARALFTTGLTLAKASSVLDALREAHPLMMADAKDEAAPEACAISPEAEYRGRENQLYRVEVHESGKAGAATFKWSRENGSVAFRVLNVVTDTDEAHVTLESLGHDRRSGLCQNDWVELIDDDIELGGAATPLLQVTRVDVQRRVVTLKGKAVAPDPARHAVLRRWDHKATAATKGAILIEEKDAATWTDLERGIRVRFITGGYYETGQYWLIPARVATGDIEWPSLDSKPRAVPPHGIKRHRAPLAVLERSPGGNWAIKP